MGKCLVTKLNGIVDNDTIKKIDEIKVPIGKGTELSFHSVKSANIRLVDGTFSDGQKIANIGNSEEKVFNNLNLGDSPYFFVDRDALDSIAVLSSVDLGCDFDISELKYCKKLGSLNYQSSKLFGSINDLPLSIYSLIVSGKNVTGDISKLPNLVNVSVNDTNVYGDISTFTRIYMFFAKNNVKITGDISQFAKDVESESKILISTPSHLSWTKERPTSATIIALENVNLGSDTDKMLINQAKCAPLSNMNVDAWYKKISITGTRTSASDAAVATLQQKGYTVSVTPA